MLWRELDWSAALERFRSELVAGPGTGSPMHELGRAYEYIEPNRRRALAIHELAGPAGLGRARELALELGWWTANARLVVLMRATDQDPRLVLDETEAWWDAGHADLAAHAFAGLRTSDDPERVEELAALIAGHDAMEHAGVTVARAMTASGSQAADAYVMAARFARAAGRTEEVERWLEAALVAMPGHRIAAGMLLEIALASREPDQIQRHLQRRFEGLDGTAWLDAMRSSALALIAHGQRGFGLRLLRHALERAYELQHTSIPGHLAMWAVLAANAAADGNRRELLPLVISGLQVSQHAVDRVWLGALATEITLRDARHPVIAGAYAEIVAEHAPEHPIVRELISTVAASEAPAAEDPHRPVVPPEAVRAAAAIEDAFDVDVDLDDVYADAADAATLDASDLEEVPEDNEPAAKPVEAPKPVEAAKPPPGSTPAPVTERAPASSSKPSPATARSIVPTAPATSAVAKPDGLAPLRSVAKPAAVVTSAVAKPAPIGKLPSDVKLPSLAKPASIGKLPSDAKLPSLAKPASDAKPASKLPSLAEPASDAKPASAPPTAVAEGRPDPAPVLAALRAPDRPEVPPIAPLPADATPRARRIAIPIDLALIVDGKRIAAHSRDISTSGLFVLTTAPLVVGAEHAIELLLPGAEPFTEDEYQARARVARAGEGGFGVELVAPDATLLAALAALY